MKTRGRSSANESDYGPLLYKSLGFNAVQQLLIQCGWISVAPFGNFINAYLVDHMGRVKMLREYYVLLDPGMDMALKREFAKTS